MPLTNARDWSLMCDKQAKLIESLRSHFPERHDSLTELSRNWRNIKQQLDQGDIPRIIDTK